MRRAVTVDSGRRPLSFRGPNHLRLVLESRGNVHLKPAVIVAAACAAVAIIEPASAGGGWRTEVVSEPVAARDPGWPVVVQRFRQPPAVTASLPRPSIAPAAGFVSGKSKHRLDGLASFYWQAQTTASGEPFDPRQLTAAHPTLPFNTLVRVQNPANGRSVVVRINDRGPFKPGRIIDLAEAAADQIGMRKAGIARVKLEVLPSGRMTAGL